MRSGYKGPRFGVFGLADFERKGPPIPAQGYCVHLSIRVKLHCHGLGPIFGG